MSVVRRLFGLFFCLTLWRLTLGAGEIPASPPCRLVILKIDGLSDDLLENTMNKRDPATGRSLMPWFTRIFRENGTIFKNFYTRGISLSTPSWALLDTGRHGVIRGNVEFDRYTGRSYDYVNFFPFYLMSARNKQVDMPAVELLDQLGIPLVMDAFPYESRIRSFQLLQRGVHWQTFRDVLKRRVKTQLFLSPVESVGPPSLYKTLEAQTEEELLAALNNSQMLYLDFYTGDVDHDTHLTNKVESLEDTLRHLDALAGRMWSAIQKSELAAQTVFVAVSDHGMNNLPDRNSQGFNLPDFLSSPAGGSHHVVTNRFQFDDYKIRGLAPLVHRTVAPSSTSTYLAKQTSYPTAWLDLDGNERAAVQLRNNDYNKLHILLQQLGRKDLPELERAAAVKYARAVIDRHRNEWDMTTRGLSEELDALNRDIENRKNETRRLPKRWTLEQRRRGEDKEARRKLRDLSLLEQDRQGYTDFVKSRGALLNLELNETKPYRGNIAEVIPPYCLGDSNSLYDLQHYVVGPKSSGVAVNAKGQLDEGGTFQTIDYFPLLLAQRVRNNLQTALPEAPVDFIAMSLPRESFRNQVPEAEHVYWLDGGNENQLLIMTDRFSRLTTRAVKYLTALPDGSITWTAANYGPNLPLRLMADAALKIPQGTTPVQWLEAWHTEGEWMGATHRCEYSNGVIGITELLSPIADNVPGAKEANKHLLRFDRRRRELVQADFHVFSSDGWNFNARNFNPGGNHGGFFRISTHSVWMMAGAGVPHRAIEQPYDSLNFASTILSAAGKPAPMPDRVVKLSNQKFRW